MWFRSQHNEIASSAYHLIASLLAMTGTSNKFRLIYANYHYTIHNIIRGEAVPIFRRKIKLNMNLLKKFHLPVGLSKKLTALAENTNHSESFYVIRALESYLSDYADAKIAKSRLNNSWSMVISSTRLKKKLGL